MLQAKLVTVHHFFSWEILPSVNFQLNSTSNPHVHQQNSIVVSMKSIKENSLTKKGTRLLFNIAMENCKFTDDFPS
jgi:hypothetical protein